MLGFLLIFLPLKKVNRPKEINIAPTPRQKYPLEFTISFSSLANMARKSERGRNKPQFSMNVDDHNGILFFFFGRGLFFHRCTIGHSQRAFSWAVICCPERLHSSSTPSQLMELQRPAHGRQRARSSLCGQNGFSFPVEWGEHEQDVKEANIIIVIY